MREESGQSSLPRRSSVAQPSHTVLVIEGDSAGREALTRSLERRCLRVVAVEGSNFNPTAQPSVESPLGSQQGGASQLPGSSPVNQQGQPPTRTPPQEAIDACSGTGEGGTCEFMAPHGRITGICRLIEGQLACVPAGGPPEGDN